MVLLPGPTNLPRDRAVLVLGASATLSARFAVRLHARCPATALCGRIAMCSVLAAPSDCSGSAHCLCLRTRMTFSATRSCLRNYLRRWRSWPWTRDAAEAGASVASAGALAGEKKVYCRRVGRGGRRRQRARTARASNGRARGTCGKKKIFYKLTQDPLHRLSR